MNLEKNKKRIISAFITTIISLIVGVVIFLIFFFARGKGFIGALDGTGYAGLFLIFAGLLAYISNEGFFDFASYGFRQLGAMLFNKSANKFNDFFSYKNYKKELRKSKLNNFIYIIIVGFLFFIVFLILRIKISNVL